MSLLLKILSNKLMFLILFEGRSYYTQWFNPENHFVDGMVVFNLSNHTFTKDGVIWEDIEEDHL